MQLEKISHLEREKCKKNHLFFNLFLNNYNEVNTHVSTKIDEKNRKMLLAYIARLVLVWDKFLYFEQLVSLKRFSQPIPCLTSREL